jgi:hypothetical protein
VAYYVSAAESGAEDRKTKSCTFITEYYHFFIFAEQVMSARVEAEEKSPLQGEKRSPGKQVSMSTRWMPRRSRPKKDAETGETFRGSCIQARNPEIPNGATPPE